MLHYNQFIGNTLGMAFPSINLNGKWRCSVKLTIVKGIVFVFFFGLVASASAQDVVGMYPRHVFEKKPLAIGTPVWVNMGDNECAYPRNDAEKYPLAADQCFESGDYVKGKIVKIVAVYWGTYRVYAYRIRYSIAPKGRKPFTGEYNGGLDKAYTFYNLPAKWADYATNFVALNW